MRILSPEKKCLYYLMISQLHEDGYTQQAMQLEVSTLYSTNNVKASDKLSRLYSCCMASVNEASNYFSSKTPHMAGRKRLGTHSAANIRAASITSLAKRRRTAATVDSTNMLQDSIKKCVKLVTTDLQKATADIGKQKSVSSSSSSNIPGTSPNLSSSSRLTSPSHVSKTKQAQRQRADGTSPVASKNNNIANVSNSFLRGINLFKSTSLPKVSPYQSPSAPKLNAASSDSAPVIRVTKNISNEPIVIDVESSPATTSGSNSSLQLTSPISMPMSLSTSKSNIPVLPVSQAPTQVRSNPLQGSNLLLTSPRSKNLTTQSLAVGTKNSAALKSLVSKISKKPVLSVQKMTIPKNSQQSPKESPSIEVVMVDDSDQAVPVRRQHGRPKSSEQEPVNTTVPAANKTKPMKDKGPNQNVSSADTNDSPNLVKQSSNQEENKNEIPNGSYSKQKSPEISDNTVPKQEETDYLKDAPFCDHTIAKEEKISSEQDLTSEQKIPNNSSSADCHITAADPASGTVLSALGLQPSKPPQRALSSCSRSEDSSYSPGPRSMTSPVPTFTSTCSSTSLSRSTSSPVSVSTRSATSTPTNHSDSSNYKNTNESVSHKLQLVVGSPPEENDFPSQIFADEMTKETPSSKSSDVLSPTMSLSDALHAATDALLEQ